MGPLEIFQLGRQCSAQGQIESGAPDAPLAPAQALVLSVQRGRFPLAGWVLIERYGFAKPRQSGPSGKAKGRWKLVTTQNSHLLRATIYMFGAIASFTAMAVAGRAVSFQLDTFEIMLFRSAVGAALVLAFGLYFGQIRAISTRHLPVHLVRNICHFTGQNLWFFAITVVPLAEVFALEFTAPLWVLLLAPLVLGERLSKTRILAGALGLLGVLLVTRPTPDTLSWGVVAGAIAAIGFAGSIMATKRLTRSETIWTVLFYMTLMQLVFGAVCAGADGDIALPSLSNMPWVVLIACAGLFAHLCLTSALSLAPATVVVPVDLLRLPVIMLVGFSLYGEVIDIYVVLGALVIFGANYMNIWIETRAVKPASKGVEPTG